MLRESSINITRVIGLVVDTRKSLQDVRHHVDEFHGGWMKLAREMAEEAGTNITMVSRMCEFKCTEKTSELLHLMNTTTKPLQFHFWTTCWS